MITDDGPPDENSDVDAHRRSADIRTPPRKLKAQRKSETSDENWDDDFASSISPRQSRMRSSIGGSESLKGRISFEKDSSPFRTPRRDLAEGLRAWSESPNSVRHRTPGLGPKLEENWDDDFAGDNADSPARASVSRSAKKKKRQSEEVENWDDEFGIQTDPGSPRPATIGRRLVQELNWESSDDDSATEFGLDRDDEEDKTVTSKHKRKPLAALNRGDAPPLPLLKTGLPTIHSGGTPGTYSMPSSPFPRTSPNHSVFSIPATVTSTGGRESTIADSTAHLALRRTHSAESGSPLPQQTFSSRYGSPSSPPRERRRLRKKSKPPHLDSSILELDDRVLGDAMPPPFRPATPENRPSTPPPSSYPPISAVSSSTGGLLSPVTPSSAMSPPLSPSSKSPLLQRIGSMKKWGSNVRKMRVSTGAESGPSTSAALSPKLRSPPIAFHAHSSSGAASGIDTERRDLNRTPRPHSYIAPSARPPTREAVSPTQTPSRGSRFFRSSSREVEKQASASRPSLHEPLSIGTSSSSKARAPSKDRERRVRDQERLRVLVPRATTLVANQPSQSGDGELGSSPRRARIRAFGQKLLSGAGAGIGRTASPDSAQGTNSSDGGDSRRSSFQFQFHSTPPPQSAPLSGEPHSRPFSVLKPRIPSGPLAHAPASLRVKGVFPRHVSGSAIQDAERKRQLRAKVPLGVHAPAMGVAGRSVSATTVSTNASSEGAGSGSAADHSGADSTQSQSHGHRNFMGSMRRISLTGRRSKTDDGSSRGNGSEHNTPDKGGGRAPELPSIPLEADSFSKHPKLLSLQTQSAKSEAASKERGKGKARTSGGLKSPISAIDLASPTTTETPKDWGAPPPPPGQSSSVSSRRSTDSGPILAHSKSSSFATATTSSSKTATSAGTAIPARMNIKTSGSLSQASQAASLSRASPLPVDMSGSDAGAGQGGMHRRSSLGDLKIPSRISRAQDGLKRDLGRVREFASCVEQMQDLRSNYFSLASRIHDILEASRPASRASITSPTSIFRSNSRARSYTTPNPSGDHRALAVGFQRIDAKYSIAWECADLLIELGTGSAAESAAPPPPTTTLKDSAAQDVTVSRSSSRRDKNRERAVTLAGDEGKLDLPAAVANAPPSKSPGMDKPPPNVSWRASTGRHDLGHRQLYLLKEMLSNADTSLTGAHLDMPPELCGLNEGMDSTITLPTDESAASGPLSPSKAKKSSKLGMIGFRDMLRSLKRRTTQNQHQTTEGQPAQSTTTVNTTTDTSTETSVVNGRKYENHPYNYNTVAAIPVATSNTRRKSETSAALHMHMADPSFSTEAMVVPHKSSPRRPSLASLFRIGQKHKQGGTGFSTPGSKEQSRVRPGTADSESTANMSGDFSSRSSLDDSDWDRMDSMSDLEHQRLAAQNGSAIAAADMTEPTKLGSTVKLQKKKRQSHPHPNPTPPRPSSPTFKLQFSGSQVSFATPSESVANFRSARLSNVDENPDQLGSTSPAAPSSSSTSRRPQSRGGRDRETKLDRPFSSVRAPTSQSKKPVPSFDRPTVASDSPNVHALPDLKLAMTPENIKPLLENARVVTTRLVDCLSEVRGLLGRVDGPGAYAVGAGGVAAAASASNVHIATA